MQSSVKGRVQICCIGASSLYGVGGTKGGWPDLLKQHVHQQMYGGGHFEELHEVYNLGVPSATIAHMLESIEVELRSRRKPNRQLITLLHLGVNDAKAVGSSTDYVSNPRQYEEDVRILLRQALALSDKVMCFGLTPVDEAKIVAYRLDKERASYFSNDRNELFERSLGKVCQELNVPFMPIFADARSADWEHSYVSPDGLHPNDAGHEWLFNRILPRVEELLQ